MDLDAETLLRVVLALVIVVLVLEVLEAVVGAFVGLLRPVFGLVIVALIVLFLLDRI